MRWLFVAYPGPIDRYTSIHRGCYYPLEWPSEQHACEEEGRTTATGGAIHHRLVPNAQSGCTTLLLLLLCVLPQRIVTVRRPFPILALIGTDPALASECGKRERGGGNLLEGKDDGA